MYLFSQVVAQSRYKYMQVVLVKHYLQAAMGSSIS